MLVLPRPGVVDDMPRVLDARTGRVEDIDWPLEREIRAILAQAQGVRSARTAKPSTIWDTSLQTMLFDRMIGT